MSNADLKGTDYIRPLTGIRAIAAYMVFMVHYNPFTKGSFLHSFFSQSYTGVSIFFVLSGFLITYRYYENYQLTGKWFLKYFQNRVARIYPLYFLLTTATFVVALITGIHSDSRFTIKQIIVNDCWTYFANITFLRGFLDRLLFSLIPQGWSLSVEETFYLSAPLFWLLSRRLKLIYQAFFLLAIGFILVLAGKHISFYGFFDTYAFMLKFTFFGRSLQFFSGMWLAFRILKTTGAGRFGNGSYKTYTGLLLVILCILGLSYAWQYDRLYLGIFIDNVLLGGAVALFFWGLITEGSKVSAFLSTSVMDLLGKSSYAFYLVHVGILQQFIDNFISKNIFIQFILLNIMSIIIYKWIETPLMIWIKSMNRGAKKNLILINNS